MASKVGTYYDGCNQEITRKGNVTSTGEEGEQGGILATDWCQRKAEESISTTMVPQAGADPGWDPLGNLRSSMGEHGFWQSGTLPGCVKGNKRREAAMATQLNFSSWKCTGTNN